jgi:hypothetical protein
MKSYSTVQLEGVLLPLRSAFRMSLEPGGAAKQAHPANR